MSTSLQKTDAAGLMQQMQAQFNAALPKHITGERFARVALSQIRGNPQLLKALNSNDGKASLLGALMQAAQLGLEPGMMGHCYLIPYGNQVQFQLGYRGMIELARRSGSVRTIYANEVCENDDFEMSFGVAGKLYHQPAYKTPRGEVVGYYAFADLGDDAYQYVFMTHSEVDRIRKTYSKASNSPWKTEFDEMAKKTVLRRLFKVLPVSIETQRGDVVDVGRAADVTHVRYDETTGEVYDETPQLEAEAGPSKAEALQAEILGGGQ